MSGMDENRYLKTLMKGAFIAFVGMIFAKIMAYVYRIMIARYFGPAEYGLFSIGLAVFTIFSVIVMIGLNNTIVHYIAHFTSKKDGSRTRGVITFSLKTVLPLSLFLSLMLYLLSDFVSVSLFHRAELGEVLRLFSIALPFYSIILLTGCIFVGFQKISYRVYTDNVVSNTLKVAFLAFFFMVGFGASGIVSSWIVGNVGGAILSVYFLYRVFPDVRKGKSVEMRREMLSYAMPLFISNIVLIVLSYTDILLLGYFPNITISSIGIYGARVSAAQLLNIMPTTLTTLFLPIMTKLREQKNARIFRNMYRTVTKWAFLVNFPIFLLMMFFSNQIMGIFFGSEFISGNASLVLLGVGYLFFSLSLIPFQLLNSMKVTKPILHVTSLTLIFNIALNLVFIPLYGIEGAALSLMIANIMRFMVLIVISYHYTGMLPFSESMAKMIISGGISLASVNVFARILFAEFPIYIMILVFVVFVSLYLMLMLVMKGFGKEDIEILREVEKKVGIRIGFLRRIINRFI